MWMRSCGELTYSTTVYVFCIRKVHKEILIAVRIQVRLHCAMQSDIAVRTFIQPRDGLFLQL